MIPSPSEFLPIKFENPFPDHLDFSVPGTVIVNVELGYPQNDKTTSQELTARLVELKDFLRGYFQSKTIAELKQEEKIKIEIRNQINDNILSKSKVKAVAFTQYDIIEQ